MFSPSPRLVSTASCQKNICSGLLPCLASFYATGSHSTDRCPCVYCLWWLTYGTYIKLVVICPWARIPVSVPPSEHCITSHSHTDSLPSNTSSADDPRPGPILILVRSRTHPAPRPVPAGSSSAFRAERAPPHPRSRLPSAQDHGYQ